MAFSFNSMCVNTELKSDAPFEDLLAQVQEQAWKHRILEGQLVAALQPSCNTVDDLNGRQIECRRAGSALLDNVLLGKSAPPHSVTDPVSLAFQMMQTTHAIHLIACRELKGGRSAVARKLTMEAARVRRLNVRPAIAKTKQKRALEKLRAGICALSLQAGSRL